VPFIRYTRDKRGCETTFVMHTYRPATGPAQTRVLYLFRSPSNLEVGRAALEPEVMEALEHTHPDLNFDWSALQRDAVTARADTPSERHSRPAGRSGTRPAAAVREPAPAPAIDDQTPLGQVAGGREAARLRTRYRELIQRIGRRARTPEDRDRLMDRAGRLNPDEWPDDVAIRAGLATLEADWDAIASELPSRRRGRRGGRRRGAETASGIMEPSETANEEVQHADVGGPGPAPDDSGDVDRVRTADDEAADPDAGLSDDD
jgi:hypothetical protein